MSAVNTPNHSGLYTMIKLDPLMRFFLSQSSGK